MAYPILYNAIEKNFDHLGLSVLSDARKALVRTERNGLFTLEMAYPINGKDVSKIKEGMILKADAGYRRKNQRFVVSKITKTNNKVEIYAPHISVVKTSMNAIRPDVSVSGSAITALERWRESLLDSRAEFFVDSDITTQASTTWKVENIENARDALGGKSGSILDVWGGEYEFDNLNIILHKQMGRDNPTIIAYGKNLLEAEQEESILSTYTSIFPFRKYTDEENSEKELLLTLPELVIDSEHANKFTHRRILKVDFSSDDKIKTVEQLRKKAQSYIKNNNVGVPKVNLKLKYQDLAKVSGVFGTPALEQVDLCDRLKVYYEDLGIVNESAKVITTVWNVITEEYDELEIGDSRSSFGESTGTMARIEALEEQLNNNSLDAEINRIIKEREEAFNRVFNEKTKELEDAVKDGVEKAKLAGEQEAGRIATEVDAKIEKERSSMLESMSKLDSGLSEAKRGLNENKTNLNNAVSQLNKAILDGDLRVVNLLNNTNVNLSNLQNALNSNKTNFDKQVNELKQLANTAQQTGKLNTSKITELENGIQREFTEVKGKIPTSIGGRNYLANTKTPHTSTLVNDNFVVDVTVYNFVDKKSLRELGFKVGDKITFVCDYEVIDNKKIKSLNYEYYGDNGYKHPTHTETKTKGTFVDTKVVNDALLDSKRIALRADNVNAKIITRNARLIKGTIATDWTPAPEDFEKDLEVTKSEFKQTSDGLFSKVEKLEEYKNADGSRTQSLKNWVQQDTADKLARERTEVNKIIDNKGFVRNEQFSNKFEENARGINRQLTELNNYKNADGSRQEALRTYSRDETARQLATERQSVERWVNSKGFATIDYANNKVQETANSFSREISNVRSSIPTSVGGRNYLANTGVPHTTTLVNDNYDVDRTVYRLVGGKTFRQLGFKLGDKVTFICDYEIIAKRKIAALGYEWYNDERYMAWMHQETDFSKNKGIFIHTSTLDSDAWLDLVTKIALRVDNVNATIKTSNARVIKGDIVVDWTPAPEDATTEINQLNTWKQTASETLNRVSSELNGTLKYSQLQITDNGINFGSGREFNGARLASMINTSPEAVQVLTNKMIVANVQNLVQEKYRKKAYSTERDLWLTPWLPKESLYIGDEYILKIGSTYWDGALPHPLNLGFHIRYKNGNDFWSAANIAQAGEEYDPYRIYGATFKIPMYQFEAEYFEFFIGQDGWDNFKRIELNDLQLYKKQSAELIVDGSITARQISAEAIEAGHIKAGAITADHIAASAITADKLLVNDAMFEKFAADKAFIDKLWAKEFMANYVKAVSIDASKITSGFISGDRINGGTITGTTISGGTITGTTLQGTTTIKLGQYGFMQPTTSGGLQICSPHNYTSKDGVGVQIIGGNDREKDVPYGMFIYRDSDFTVGNTAEDSDSYLLTVNGYIKTKGVNYLTNKIINYSVNNQIKTYAAQLNFYTHTDISLNFGQYVYNITENGEVIQKDVISQRDIYYRYGSEYISLYYNLKAASSDRNLKENIIDTSYKALDFVKQFKFKEHDWKEGKELYRKKHTKIGLIAQEVQDIDDSLVYKNGEYLSLDTLRLANLALKAIQELDSKNKDLEQKIKLLEEKVNE